MDKIIPEAESLLESLEIDYLYDAENRDEILARMITVVDWLHDVAATDGADDGKLDALDFSTQSDIYSETSDFIKENGGGQNRAEAVESEQGDGKIFTLRLDPDACDRTGSSFTGFDEVRHLELMRSLWQLVRSGANSVTAEEQMERAKQLCHACGESWRATSLCAPAGCTQRDLGRQWPGA